MTYAFAPGRAIQERAHQPGGVLVASRHPGGIRAQGDVRVGVSEAPGDGSSIDTGRDQLRGHVMPEIM
jgi:PAB1-binding protein PBP1